METRKVESFTGRFSKNCIIFFRAERQNFIEWHFREVRKNDIFGNNYDIKIEVSLCYNFILIDPKNYENTIAHVWVNVIDLLQRARCITSAHTYTPRRASSSSPDINAITNNNKIQSRLVNSCASYAGSNILMIPRTKEVLCRSRRRIANFDRRVTLCGKRTIDRESRPDNLFSSTRSEEYSLARCSSQRVILNVLSRLRSREYLKL